MKLESQFRGGEYQLGEAWHGRCVARSRRNKNHLQHVRWRHWPCDPPTWGRFITGIPVPSHSAEAKSSPYSGDVFVFRTFGFGAQIFSSASASWLSMFSLEHSLQHWFATSYGLPLALYHSSCSWDLNQGHFWVFGSTTFAAAGDSQRGMCARCLFCPGRVGPANRTCRVPALSANGWGGSDLPWGGCG